MINKLLIVFLFYLKPKTFYMKRKLLISFLFLFLVLPIYAQYTSIPDANFENKLIQLGIDTGASDGKVLTSRINSVQALDISLSNISDLTGIENFTELATLSCLGNNLISLDVSKNTKLNALDCSANQLTYLNISNLLLLNGINCSDNELISLDISQSPILNAIRCKNNNLISLNLKNGNNINFNDFFIDFKNNPRLACIQVDDVTYSNARWRTYKDDGSTYSNSCGPRYTSIPNSFFENKLISLGIDTDGKNGKVLTSNIIFLTSLDISSSSITDITGIEDFLNLTNLNISNNTITRVNLTWLKKLKTVNCSSNVITTLDVSKNTKLENLDFSNNSITTINLSANPLLINLKANRNSLSALNIDSLKAVKTVEVGSNQLTVLNLTENILLEQLKCNNNNISVLNIAKNKNLLSLYCGYNKITNLDITTNAILREISCENNLLTSLNLKNGNNTQFSAYDFRNNSGLTCIEVDNSSYSIANWSAKKDATTSYNLFCGPFTTIPDVNFENKLIALGIDVDGQNGKVVTASISNLTTIDLSNSSIVDLTGIQYFINLKNLNISGNQLTNVDLSNNKALEILNCSNNQLTTLDVLKNIQLIDFYCNNNLLTTLNLKNGRNTRLINLDFRNNPKLSCILVDAVSYSNANWSTKKDAATSFEIICGDYTLIPDYNFETFLINKGIDIDGRNGKILTSSISGLTSLDLSNYSIATLTGIEDFKSLVSLSCTNTKITTLDLSKNTAIETLNCSASLLTNLNITNNKKLVTLNCSKNNLPSLDLTQNTSLQSLDVSTNSVSLLDVSQNIKLTTLKCDVNKLTGLDISQNISLDVLSCSQNKISSLNVSSNTKLTNLNCSSNQINVLDASKNILLTNLSCFSNQINVLDVSKNISLTNIDCNSNKIETLDLSKNTLLKTINCSYNLLTSLNMKNGNNTIFTSISASSNPNLLCIQIDNEDYFNNKFKFYKDSGASYSEDCGQYTLIPDPNFEDRLIANLIDLDGKNGKVQTFRIKERTALYLSYYNISDMTGIQDFKALQSLQCASNNLTSIDLSKNLSLKTLDCSGNTLTNLDLSKNVLLTEVYCQKNQLSDLDISNNKVLTRLDCTENQLTSLNLANGNNKNITSLYNKSDFRKNPNLTCIFVDNVDYSTLNWFELKDPTANYSRSCGSYADIPDANLEVKLISLGFDKDGLNGKILKSDAEAVTDLNISGSSITNVSVLEYFTALKSLNCSNNNITVLNLNKNKLLTSLDCSNTKITSLELENNTNLTSLNAGNNKLTFATVKNGNNTNIQYINIKNNTSLTCIEVDNLNYSNTNWVNFKDTTSNFSVSCGIYTQIPDDNFEYKLISLGIDKDGKNNKVLTSNISKLTSLDLSNSQISDLTGIQNFTAIKTLNFDENLVTNVDLSKNTELLQLSCSSNALTTIDVTPLKKITTLHCDNNKFKELNVELNTNLIGLYFSNNELKQINITKNTVLEGFSCRNNQITSLDVSKNILLRGIDANDNQLTELDLSQCPTLDQISLENNKLTSTGLIIPKTAPLRTVNLSINQLTNLDLSNYSKLESLRCSENKLVTLKASNNPLLNELQCRSNELISLDITNDPLIIELDCAYNKLVTIDLSQNSGLKTMWCQNNNLTNLDFSGVTHLMELYAINNKLRSLNLDYLFYSGNLSGNITNNPELYCINIKKGETKPQTSWSLEKDPIAQYATDCVSITTITDPNFEDFLIAAGIDKDGRNGKVLTTYLSNITTLDISNSGITDLKGIEDFAALKKLDCSGNAISSINLTSNLMLDYLDCSNTPLTTLNISNNSLLKELYCDGIVTITSKSKADNNKLATLDVSNNLLLTKLSCSNNQLTSLDLSKNALLTDINCSNNDLSDLNLQNGNNASFTNLNFKNNAKLTCINVDNGNYSTTNWSDAKDNTASYSSTCKALGSEESILEKVNIYPNPTKGELNINNIVLEKIMIYNTIGQLVKTLTFTSGSNNNTLDLKGLPSGIYYLFIEIDGAHAIRKIIIQ